MAPTAPKSLMSEKAASEEPRLRTDASDLHQDAINIDATCQLLFEKKHLRDYQARELTAVAPTVGGWKGASQTLSAIATGTGSCVNVTI